MVLPPSHRLQVPIRTDNQDTTGGGLLGMYGTKPEWNFKFGDWIQDSTYSHLRTLCPGIELSIRKYWSTEDYFGRSQRRSQAMTKDILSDEGWHYGIAFSLIQEGMLLHHCICGQRKYGPRRGIGDNKTNDES
ncbi:hypothetical protein BS47DRAFT_1357474 [Hydnum rufescens UP504]|uniref:Uncharacterized protein n=1 Tax=Hydnum rufescens UP504 TaxID=1448309 RepID=A0A9P6BDA7_9AGAM|nr:hypothetical protein BS47DRAFT_1357474 [Hydnum rufescens UP504]